MTNTKKSLNDVAYFDKMYLRELFRLFGDTSKYKKWIDIPLCNTLASITIPDDDVSRKVWIWSDTHLGHFNILRHAKRPFPDLDLMHSCLFGNYINLVGEHDIVIWVGDVAYKSSTTKINGYLDRLPGYKILVVGNHDFSRKRVRGLNFDEIHRLMHIKLLGIEFVLTHYPMRSLPFPYFNIHGHTHLHNMETFQHINVCVEQLNYAPVDIMEIAAQTKKELENI